ncbi:MAG: carbon storage regulator [Pirellulales bacterium]|nr:carbon storage regulator [Pirellulales bacterium]
MLVLSRKPNETIHIGNDITLVVLDVRGNRVCLGIEAPSQVVIRRGELEPHSELAVGRTTNERSALLPVG